MTSTPEKSDKFLLAEQKIIHLLLKDKQAIKELLENNITHELFADRHCFLVSCIFQEYMDGESSYPRLLTRQSYEHHLKQKFGKSVEILSLLKMFDLCIYKISASIDDLGTLKIELMNGYAARQAQKSFDLYEKAISNKGMFLATQELIDSLGQVNLIKKGKQSEFGTLLSFQKEYLAEKEKQRENPQEIIKCGIEEFDKVMGIGLAPGTLTLVVGDTGCGKTNTMLSMGLNIAKQGRTVLFISLEMNRLRLMDRIICNIAGLDFDKVAKPYLMSDQEFLLLKDAFNKWKDEYKDNFAILDVDEWISISMLKREVELRSMIFQANVLFVDYIGMVKPENRYKDRHDIELGEISKSLRFLGKKYNFATVSASQLNREAIRRMRKNKENLAGSEDLRGSGELSNDSDYIFALFPTNEINKLKGQTIKSRYGQSHNTFSLYFNGRQCLVGDYTMATMLPDEMDASFSNVFSSVDDSESQSIIHELDDLDFE